MNLTVDEVYVHLGQFEDVHLYIHKITHPQLYTYAFSRGIRNIVDIEGFVRSATEHIVILDILTQDDTNLLWIPPPTPAPAPTKEDIANKARNVFLSMKREMHETHCIRYDYNHKTYSSYRITIPLHPSTDFNYRRMLTL